ncbi:alpha/beta hydrolase [Pseudomonas sp. HK3]
MTKTLDKQQKITANILACMPPLHSLPPKLARPMFTLVDRLLGIPNAPLNNVKNISIATHDGRASLPLRIYYPNKSLTQNETTHAMMFFHGGGGVIGSLNSHDRLCRYLAQFSNVVIISVGYRLAPEHKFPTAIHDAIDAWNWLHNNKQTLAIQNHHIGAGGDSAGAYLATLLSLTQTLNSRPIKVSTPPEFQYLLYPMVDLRGLTPSYLNAHKGMLLTKKLMDYFRKHFLVNLSQSEHAIVSPLLADDLHLLPTTYLLSVEHDPLKDSGIAFAQTLIAQGVSVTHEHFDDCMHSFISTYKVSQRAQQGVNQIAQQLKQLCST